MERVGDTVYVNDADTGEVVYSTPWFTDHHQLDLLPSDAPDGIEYAALDTTKLDFSRAQKARESAETHHFSEMYATIPRQVKQYFEAHMHDGPVVARFRHNFIPQLDTMVMINDIELEGQDDEHSRLWYDTLFAIFPFGHKMLWIENRQCFVGEPGGTLEFSFLSEKAIAKRKKRAERKKRRKQRGLWRRASKKKEKQEQLPKLVVVEDEVNKKKYEMWYSYPV